VAAARSLEKHRAWDGACFLKWPNDLFRKEANTPACRKLGGILTEMRKNVLLIGIGINVNQAPALEASRYESTSLADFMSQPPTASTLANTLMIELSDLVSDWIRNETLISAQAISELEGNWMRPFFSMRGEVDGVGEVRAEGLLADGRLEVSALSDRSLRRAVTSGEFRLLE
jgi:biotin-(acetyl-CoA carboxylase) ligase